MTAILHIFTKPADPLVQEIISRQLQEPDTAVEVVDLSQPAPDYAALLDKVFAADSVTVW